jgi:hypothetical protein
MSYWHEGKAISQRYLKIQVERVEKKKFVLSAKPRRSLPESFSDFAVASVTVRIFPLQLFNPLHLWAS